MCAPGHCFGGINCTNSQQVGEGCESAGSGCTSCAFGLIVNLDPPAPISDAVFDAATGKPHPMATEAALAVVIRGGHIPPPFELGDAIVQINGDTILDHGLAPWYATLHTVGPREYVVIRQGSVLHLTA
jgi:hypothetical protein